MEGQTDGRMNTAPTKTIYCMPGYEIVCVYSLESSDRGNSNDYTHHTIIL